MGYIVSKYCNTQPSGFREVAKNKIQANMEKLDSDSSDIHIAIHLRYLLPDP